MEKIGKYPADIFDMEMFRKLGQVRKLQEKYHLAAGVDKKMIQITMKSPIMGIKDLWPLMIGMMVNMQLMKDLISFDLRVCGFKYQVPVYYILGENDQQTPIEISMKYFDEIVDQIRSYILSKMLVIVPCWIILWIIAMRCAK